VKQTSGSVFGICIVVVAVLLTACQSAAPGAPGSPKGDPAVFIQKLAEDSGIQTDRRRLSPGYYDATVNKTFLSWMGENASVVIASYDHATKLWSKPRKIADSPFADKHNYPHLVQGADGHALIVFGCHNSVLMFARSAAPHSVEGDWKVSQVAQAEKASYPMPIVLKNGNLVVFYRETMQDIAEQPKNDRWPTDYRPLRYIVSKDSGITWSAAKTILDNYPRTDNLCEMYLGEVTYQPAAGNRPERILITWALAGGGPTEHAHNVILHGVYFAAFDPSSGNLFGPAGNNLGDLVDNTEMESSCIVAKTDNPNPDNIKKSTGYSHQVSYTDDGRPVVVYKHFGDVKSATWDGKAWKLATVVAATEYQQFDGDLEKVGAQSFKTYTTMGGIPFIRVSRSDDAGLSWKEIDRFAIPGIQRIAKAILIDGYKPEAKMIITELNGTEEDVTVPTRDIFAVADRTPGLVAMTDIPAYVAPTPKPSKTPAPVNDPPMPASSDISLLTTLKLPVEAPWQSADIGKPMREGTFGSDSDKLVLIGGGYDIWGTRDEFRFLHTQISGNFTMVVKAETISDANKWTKSGIMVRQSLDEASPNVLNAVSFAYGTSVQWRLVQGEGSDRNRATTNTQGAPRWLKIVRKGNEVQTFDSADGKEWRERNPMVTIELKEKVYVGFAVTSHDALKLARGTFSNISITKD